MKTKKLTKRERVIQMLMERPNAKRENYYHAIIITYDPLSLAVYRYKKGFKPSEHLRFKTSEERSEYIGNFKKSVKRDAKAEARLLEECQARAKRIKEGSILYASWGYGQTNIDFYKVLDRKNRMLTVQEIGQERIMERDDSGTCVPRPEIVKGEPFRKILNPYARIKINSVASAKLWDGEPKYFSCCH